MSAQVNVARKNGACSAFCGSAAYRDSRSTWTVDEATGSGLTPQIAKLREIITAAEADKTPPVLISLYPAADGKR